MKSVLLVATVGGFVPQFELNDVKLLRELECEIHYAANFDYSVYNVSDKLLAEHKLHKHQLDIHKSPFKLIQNYRAYKELKRLIDKLDIELVHCHTPVGGLISRLAASKSHKKPKVIYTAHGFHFYKGAPLLNWCTYYLVERFLAKKTDVIVTINQEDYIRACGFRMKKNGKVYKIPGVGINHERFNAKMPKQSKEIEIKEIRNETSAGDKKIFRLVTVAELSKNKNHQIVIRALEKLGRNDIYYDIYGGGPYENELRKLIIDLKLEKYIKLRGYAEKPENVLKSSDCFVFPSLREGLGMAALEAMASGVPVIANDNRGTREYMRDGYNGIVCKNGTVEEYARAIETMVEDYETRKQQGQNAIKTSMAFDIKYTEETMRMVYNTLI